MEKTTYEKTKNKPDHELIDLLTIQNDCSAEKQLAQYELNRRQHLEILKVAQKGNWIPIIVSIASAIAAIASAVAAWYIKN